MVVLITGGTGSFGSALARHLLATTDHKIRILDRSEAKLENLSSELRSPRCTYILADIRDAARLDFAFSGVDFIFHAAALKTVPFGEIHVSEFIKTNIVGTANVVSVAGKHGVKRVLLISSDKACSPFNKYGQTKAVAEGIIIEANMLHPNTKFASVRGGNVWGSRGSVAEKWIRNDIIEIFDEDITRFHLPMEYWLSFCVRAITDMHGGEIFIPKCKAWQLGDLANAFVSCFPQKEVVVGDSRDGDKQHESLISQDETRYSADIFWAYVIQPNKAIRDVWSYQEHYGLAVTNAISSDLVERMTIEELEETIREYRRF